MIKLAKTALRAFLVIFSLTTLFVSTADAFFSDVTLPRITKVKKVVQRSSVGLEWKSVANFANVTGINIYRAEAKPGVNQIYKKIDSIGNRFATHYVDMHIKPNTKYFYTLTTTSGLNESTHGDIIPVLTKPPYKKIKLVSVYQVAKDTVKILWVPSSNDSVYKYIIQRRNDNSKWFYLDTIKGRLYPEYIDTTAKRGHTYSYRVIGYDAYGLSTIPSNEIKVEVK
jgi:fibronectin type 3 domain-containing protein